MSEIKKKTDGPESSESSAACSRSHLRFGWRVMLVFLSLGIILETLHGLKVGWYLNVSTEMRRLLLTLAHAHGTLLGLVNIAFAFTVNQLPDWPAKSRGLASLMLKTATWLLPGGFLLGGLFIHQGDPGIGIFLVPVGATCLLISVYACARAAGSSK